MHLRVGLASGPDHTPSVTCGGGGPPARALAHGRECTRARRNQRWLRQRPWFEAEVLPALRQAVVEMLARP